MEGMSPIFTSPDGVTWTPRNSGTSNTLLGIAWSGTQFVAIGIGGAILTSFDGQTWSPQNSGTTFSLNGISWSGTQFVAVGGLGNILTSP
jgi:hypothetical protein